MNTVVLIGNLTRDPELRYSSGTNQTAICKFTVAVNDGYGDKQQTSFIPIVVFGKQAENCDKFLAKGRKAAITGRIQTGSYEKDGRTIYTTDVIANNVEFLSSGQTPRQAPPQQAQQASTPPMPDASYQPAGYSALTDDEIPF